jgi:DNA (cytosine-5)-methyltransferase 1
MGKIPVIDIFAGPGGLAEGFASYARNGWRPFRIALSIEKDAQAHQTLSLRAFYRQFGDDVPAAYYEMLTGRMTRQALFEAFPEQSRRAISEALHHELSQETARDTQAAVKKALGGRNDAWCLIGGPPCQAYSLVGRSRNRGNSNYRPEVDQRQTLYIEYLQILADHRPAVFVMENVKGLLSATLNSAKLFERILDDLRNPAHALAREGRSSASRGPRYEIHSIADVVPSMLGDSPSDAVLKAEDYGVPQARHRVILVGVLQGVGLPAPGRLTRRKPQTAGAVLARYPRLRSGLSDVHDDAVAWADWVRAAPSRGWIDGVDQEVADRVREVAGQVSVPRAGRGNHYLPYEPRRGSRLPGVVNHATRSHLRSDLDRYLFASCFAKVHGVSPLLAQFPTSLLPEHANVGRAVASSHFSDRFRVQLADRPSTTITSHISKDGHYFIHPDPTQCRSLTVREAAALQTFDDDYFFCGPRTSQYQQVGNAVPPMLARQIAEVVAALF